MKNCNLEKLEILLLSENGLIIKLRMGEGLDSNLVDEICETLSILKDEWKNSLFIPKKAVDMFVDFYPAMESCIGLYDQFESDKIMLVTDRIMDSIRECYCNYV